MKNIFNLSGAEYSKFFNYLKYLSPYYLSFLTKIAFCLSLANLTYNTIIIGILDKSINDNFGNSALLLIVLGLIFLNIYFIIRTFKIYIIIDIEVDTLNKSIYVTHTKLFNPINTINKTTIEFKDYIVKSFFLISEWRREGLRIIYKENIYEIFPKNYDLTAFKILKINLLKHATNKQKDWST